jgi:hypothetical protein
MPTINILDAEGAVINTIVADEAFAEATYPGQWALAPESEPAPPAPPRIVTMRQARMALLSVGLLDDVEAAINALPSPMKEAARIEWEYSGTVERDRPLIQALAPALGLDDAAMDALFTAAARL